MIWQKALQHKAFKDNVTHLRLGPPFLQKLFSHSVFGRWWCFLLIFRLIKPFSESSCPVCNHLDNTHLFLFFLYFVKLNNCSHSGWPKCTQRPPPSCPHCSPDISDNTWMGAGSGIWNISSLFGSIRVVLSQIFLEHIGPQSVWTDVATVTTRHAISHWMSSDHAGEFSRPDLDMK